MDWQNPQNANLKGHFNRKVSPPCPAESLDPWQFWADCGIYGNPEFLGTFNALICSATPLDKSGKNSNKMTSQEINMNDKGLTEGEFPDDKVVGSPNKPPQKSFTEYVIQMALDQIDALSDCLIAIQASKYEVDKNTIASLAFLIREKTQNIKNFMEEMAREKRSLVLEERISREIDEGPSSLSQPEAKSLLFSAIMRWYEKEGKKTHDS